MAAQSRGQRRLAAEMMDMRRVIGGTHHALHVRELLGGRSARVTFSSAWSG